MTNDNPHTPAVGNPPATNLQDGSEIKFYHPTITKCCQQTALMVNTHRTDFVGFSRGNRVFNVRPDTISTNFGSVKLSTADAQLASLADALLSKQGPMFFLNEYPEECDHRQFIDIDYPLDDEALTEIVDNLKELVTKETKILVMRNSSSNKVHLIIDAPAFTSRFDKFTKQGINDYLCEYLTETCRFDDLGINPTKWKREYFDGKARGIRSIFSVKVANGELVKNDMYLPCPDGLNPITDQLTRAQKIALLVEYSIYKQPTGKWLPHTIEEFKTAANTCAITAEANETIKLPNDYDSTKKTIAFNGAEYPVSQTLVNEMISLLPIFWSDKFHWKFACIHIKTIAGLIAEFDPQYFLHVWSRKQPELYNAAGNDKKYNSLMPHKSAGESLTWLRNQAQFNIKNHGNYKQLIRGDLGPAILFADVAGPDIKITNDAMESYMWDHETKLWKARSKKWLTNSVMTTLEPMAAGLVKFYSSFVVLGPEILPQLKSITKFKSSIVCQRTAKDIAITAAPLMEDMYFQTTINLQHDLLPIRGGLVVDLQTGITGPREQAHNFTVECNVEIDNDPERLATVEQFMAAICDNNAGLLRYLQTMLGYFLTGQITEKAVFIWWGENDNGKSTIMNLMKLILGDFCSSLSKSAVIKVGESSRLTPEREALKDARIATFSESGAEDILNDELLKIASGDDPVRVNPKYGKEYSFVCFAKLLMATNHKPRFNVEDQAMVGRIRYMPFLVKFVKNPTKPNERARNVVLARAMKTTLLNAFFTWVLAGAVRWYKNGLADIPDIVQSETTVLLQENDIYGEFLAAEVTNCPNSFVQSTVLFNHFKQWCELTGNPVPKTAHLFSPAIAKRYEKTKIAGIIKFRGMKLRTVCENDNLNNV